MKLVGRIPVEPLDDERLTNIERRIVTGAADATALRPASGPRRGFGLGLAFAAAAVAAVCAGVIGFQFGDRRAAPVVGEAAPIRVDTAAERTTLDIGDAQLQSDPATVFVVTRPAGGVLVEMTRGKIELEVGKRGDRPPLVVRAGDTDVVVIGTHFTVDYGDGTGDVEVVVTEGVVKVVRHRQEARVAAGQAWRASRGMIALAEAGARVGRQGAAGATPTDPTRGQDVVAAANPAPTGDGAYEIDMGAAPDVLRERTAQVPDPRTPEVAPRPRPAPATLPATERSTTSTPPRIDPRDPARNLKQLIAKQPVAPALDVGEPVAATAVSKYYEIIRNHTGEEEARAYYSIAVTQYAKLGRSGDALKTIDLYFQRFRAGSRVYPEHAAARWLQVRILCLRAIDDRCRAAAAAYLRLTPGTPTASVAELITLAD